MRNLRTPPPREPTFSEMLAQNLQEPPDFRTEGEKRRDARQAAARRQPPPKREPSSTENLLAQLEAERKRKERKAEAPSSQGKQIREGKDEKQPEIGDNIRRALDKLKEEFPSRARIVIAGRLIELGRQLAVAGAEIFSIPFPGAQFVGVYLMIKSASFIVGGIVIYLDLFGILRLPEEQEETPDAPIPKKKPRTE